MTIPVGNPNMIQTGNRKLAYVEWVDCYGCSPNWVDFDDINKEPLTCTSVGWIVLDNKEVLVIVPHFTQENHDGAKFQGCGDMTIPKSAVRNIVYMGDPTIKRIKKLTK